MARQFRKYPADYVKADTEGKYYPTTDEEVAFAESIPMEGLFDKIREVTDMPELEFEHEVKVWPHGNGVGVKFSSQDIADRIGIFDLVFKTLRISSFNSSVGWDDKRNELYLWCTVHFSYELQSMGSNGADFMTCWYSNTRGWEFMLEKDRRAQNDADRASRGW